MGVAGLLRAVRGSMQETHISEYAGYTLGVDTSCWLHRGATACARELCLHGANATAVYLEFLRKRVAMLQSHGIEPLMVLDGAPVPCKRQEEESRMRDRSAWLQRASQLECDGNTSAAAECYQKAVHISSAMRNAAVSFLRASLGVRVIVAPFEADAQLAYLERNGVVNAVITEDSDLVPLGCYRVLFKLDKHGFCEKLKREWLSVSSRSSVDFSGFSEEMLITACALSGCDYLRGVQGIGIKRARDLVRQRRTPERIVQKLRMDGCTIASDLLSQLHDAVLAFSHPWVYCPLQKHCVRLWPLERASNATQQHLDRLVGTPPECRYAPAVAEGRLDPVTFEEVFVSPKQTPQARIDTFFTRKPSATLTEQMRCHERKPSHDWEAEAVCKRATAASKNDSAKHRYSRQSISHATDNCNLDATQSQRQTQTDDERVATAAVLSCPSAEKHDDPGSSSQANDEDQHADNASMQMSQRIGSEGISKTTPGSKASFPPMTQACAMPSTEIDKDKRNKLGKSAACGNSRFFAQAPLFQHEVKGDNSTPSWQYDSCSDDISAGYSGYKRQPLTAISPNAKSHRKRLEHYADVARATLDCVESKHASFNVLEQFRLSR